MSECTSVYVRHVVEQMTAASRRPGDGSLAWDYTHLLGIIHELDSGGYGDAVRAAADRALALWRDVEGTAS